MPKLRLFACFMLAALAALSTLAAAPSVQAQPPAGLGELHGKVVWVDFWASWCAPCRRSFPWLNEMQQKYGPEGLEIVGVNVDKDRKLADAFLAETPAKFSLRFDPEGELAKAFDVQAMPSSYVLDADGRVLARHFGFRLEDRAEYEQLIRTALAKASAAPAAASRSATGASGVAAGASVGAAGASGVAAGALGVADPGSDGGQR